MTIWERLVQKKADFIGGVLEDDDNNPWIKPECRNPKTIITDMTFADNEFRVLGEDFNCGGNTEFLGVNGSRGYVPGTIFLCGYGGHQWSITVNKIVNETVVPDNIKPIGDPVTPPEYP